MTRPSREIATSFGVVPGEQTGHAACHVPLNTGTGEPQLLQLPAGAPAATAVPSPGLFAGTLAS